MLPLAFCGNDCNVCPRLVATNSEDPELLREVAILWHRLGYRDTVVSPEEMACHGCQSQTHCRYDIHSCVVQRNVLQCGRCDEYPCEKIEEAFKVTESFASQVDSLESEIRDRLREAFFFKRKRLESDRE